jgi:transcriptional regulator with XRE-family HTH domain
MNIALLIITAITIEKLTQNEVAQRYGVSQSWVAARSLGNESPWVCALLAQKRGDCLFLTKNF